MKKITIPENTRVIIEDGVILFEGTTPKELEVGKWYESEPFTVLVIDLQCNSRYFTAVGFCPFYSWIGLSDSSSKTWIKHIVWQPADMKEVTRLLIGEAEKRYGTTPDESRNIGDSFFMKDDSLMTNGYSNNKVVFDVKTGKWAEIIPEKKPLYTNAYGTEFFGEEQYFFIRKDGSSIFCGDRPFKDSHYKNMHSVAFYGTEPECHRYIYENWDKLNK
jgi:hypothetical protein